MAVEGDLVAGRYRLARPLATGGLSEVWLATDAASGRAVAVKQCVLPPGLPAAKQALVRDWTVREAGALTGVRHPCVVPVLDVVPDPVQPWIVMEYVPSRSLQRVIDSSGPLPPRRVAAIGLAVLAGLAAAARAGLLHLDVKPGNVLIADDGRVVLGDFGPVVTVQGVEALAAAGIRLGSPNYVAPERLLDGASSTRSDLWSLGATLYHAVEGRPPYRRATIAATLEAIVRDAPDPCRLAGPLAPVLDGLLQHDPAARTAAADTAGRLRAVVLPPVPARPHRVAPPARRPPVRRRAAMLTALSAVAALTVAATGVPAQGPAASYVTASGGSAVTASATPRVVPPGFRWWYDRAGFQVAVPGGWRSTPDGGALRFSAPGGGPSLRISEWTAGTGTAVARLVAEERAVRLGSYRRIRIEGHPGPPDAVWEYTYRDARGDTVRVLERVVAAGTDAYRLQWRAPQDGWAAALPALAAVLDSFGPRHGA
jgi:hypothetical protein